MIGSFRQFLENTPFEGDFKTLQVEMPLEKEVLFVHELFKKEGFDLVVVGGAVRDFLYHMVDVFKKRGHDVFALKSEDRQRLCQEYRSELNQFKAKDIDLATEATPAQKKKVLSSPEAKAARVTYLEIGAAFGVVTAQVPSKGKLKQYEIATYREDSKTGDGRRPDSVTFSNRVADVQRRDLTVNALIYDMDTKDIRDYNGGRGFDDVRNNTINTVGEPYERFDEDRLRPLRLIRFFARYNNGGPEEIAKNPKLDAAMRHFRDLHGVSEERIKQEFIAGIQQAKNVPNYLKIYNHYGIFDRAFPGLKINQHFDRLNILERDPNMLHNPRLVMAWLLKDNDPNMVERVLAQMKYFGGTGKQHKLIQHVGLLLKLAKFSPQDVAIHAKWRDALRPPLNPDEKEVLIGDTKQDHNREILAWAALAGLDQNMIAKFIQFELSVRGDDPDMLKYQGAARGQAIKDREAELFRQHTG